MEKCNECLNKNSCEKRGICIGLLVKNRIFKEVEINIFDEELSEEVEEVPVKLTLIKTV